MPRPQPLDDLRTVLQLVTTAPAGRSLTELDAALAGKYPRRSLQRYLAGLVSDGSIRIEGKGPATRYFPAIPRLSPAVEPVPVVRESGEAEYRSRDLVLSEEARKLQAVVRQPVHLRGPVGYNRSFLESYEPNRTFYLPEADRERLYRANQLREGDLPAGTHARKIYSRLLIDLSWNSSRLEGNTYSLLETDQLLNLGRQAEGKDAREAQMILNHKEAIDMLVEQADVIGFDGYTIKNLHAALSEGLLDDMKSEGRLRTIAVGIGGTSYRPVDVPQLVDECFHQLLEKGAAISDPFEQAFFAMVHIPYLQPFEDVNKRTSRLAANIPLIRQNYCPLSFVGVSNRLYVDGLLAVYEVNRVDLLREIFVWAYEKSCARYSMVQQTVGDPDPVRVKYRDVVKGLVADVVRARLDKASAARYIHDKAEAGVAAEDRVRVVELVEGELMDLHDGCIARYRLRPSEFYQWQKTWR